MMTLTTNGNQAKKKTGLGEDLPESIVKKIGDMDLQSFIDICQLEILINIGNQQLRFVGGNISLTDQGRTIEDIVNTDILPRYRNQVKIQKAAEELQRRGEEIANIGQEMVSNPAKSKAKLENIIRNLPANLPDRKDALGDKDLPEGVLNTLECIGLGTFISDYCSLQTAVSFACHDEKLLVENDLPGIKGERIAAYLENIFSLFQEQATKQKRAKDLQEIGTRVVDLATEISGDPDDLRDILQQLREQCQKMEVAMVDA